MIWFYIVLIVISSTFLWIISRWAMKSGGDSKVQGFWISITGCIISGCILLIHPQSIFITPVIISSAMVAFASSIGYLVIMMYCLKIGPSGLTLTVNNSAMVFGVLYSFLFLDPHIPNIFVILGILGVLSGLILIGLSSVYNNSSAPITLRWVKLVMIGGGLSGLSFINQAYLGTCHPGIEPLLVFIFWFNLFSVMILLGLIFYTKVSLIRRTEIRSGITIGILNNTACFLTLFCMKYLGAHIILPIVVAAPMIIMLFVGHYVYKEHLKMISWIGAIIAICSVLLLSIKN